MLVVTMIVGGLLVMTGLSWGLRIEQQAKVRNETVQGAMEYIDLEEELMIAKLLHDMDTIDVEELL